MTGDLNIGIVGLGKMGKNLTKHALDKDIRVVGVEPDDRPELASSGVTVLDAGEYDQLANELDPPRVVLLFLPLKPVVDEVIDELSSSLDNGDVIVDGGNSFWRDSMRREERMAEKGVYFLDCGASGGPFQARQGLCFTVGGKEEGFEIAEPLLDELSVDGGLHYTGPPGSGHFAKLIHNGIEFGMVQALAEGVDLLKAGNFEYDLGDLFGTWSNGAVIQSYLVSTLSKGFNKEEQFAETDTPDFEDIPNYVADTGEVNWVIEEAIKGETPAPIITQSVIELFKSRGNQRHAYRTIALLRHGYGGHPFGEADELIEERKTARITNTSRYKLNESDDMDTVRPVDRSDE